MKRNRICPLAILAITLMSGCSLPGKSARNANLGADQDTTRELASDEDPNDAEPGATMAAEDQETSLQGPTKNADGADEQAPATSWDGQDTKAQESIKEGEDSSKQTATMPVDGQDTAQPRSSEQQGDQGAGGQSGEAEPSSLGQSIGLLPTTGNALWVTAPAPYDVEPNQRNFLVAGVNLNEISEVIPAKGPTNPFRAYSSARIFGSLRLTKEVHRFQTMIDYKGGVSLHGNSDSSLYGNTVQQVTATEEITWQKTRLFLEDALSDAPGASFGSNVFGGASANTLGYGNPGGSDFLGSTDFGGFRTQRLNNLASAQVTQTLNQRSGISFGGSYAITQYFNNNLINTQLLSAVAAYNREVTPRTQVSAVYSYQYWKFPGGYNTKSQTVQVAYTHQFSPRATVSFSVGPQLSSSQTPIQIPTDSGPFTIFIPSHQLGISANASLGYGLKRGSVGLSYEHFLTSGSGFYAGASSDIASLTLTRDIWRAWVTNFSSGFVRLTSLGNQSSIAGSSYQSWFVSVGVQRTFGRHLSLLGSYQFNDSTSIVGCPASVGCGSILHTAIISLAWHTLPIRLGGGNLRNVDSGTSESPSMNVENPKAENH